MKLRTNLFFLVLIIAILLITASCNKMDDVNDDGEPLSRTEFLMDTVITLRIYDKKDEKIMDRVIDRLREIEERMSKTIPTSDISLINRNAGIEPVKVNEDVYYVIKQAKKLAEITDGVYEPTIGPLVELWDIAANKKEEVSSIPTEKEIEEARKLVNYEDLELMDDNQVFLKRKGMKIDLGGIAKGYAADEVKRILLEEGVRSAIIDLGGNVYALGKKNNGQLWRIGIQDPFDSTGNYLGISNVEDKSIVTSGDYERYYLYKGHKYHHILDPNTGYPSESGLRSVSIISDKSIEGDALSTALFILGVEKGTEVISKLEGIEAIFITKEGEVIVGEKLMDNFSLKGDKLKLVKNPYS